MSRPEKRSWATTRRRILGGLGAGGLAVAGVVFGRPTAAFAVKVGCCNTCHKPSISVAKCRTYGGHYLWVCNQSSSISCQCCESKGGGCSYMVSSAVSCSYG